jgi:hypothetical protein
MRFLLCVALLGCGSRSDIEITPPSSDATSDVSTVDASNTTIRDAIPDVPEDVIVVTDAGCSTDADCKDPFACTEDRCDPMLKVCTHAPKNSLCDDGLYCTGDEFCSVQTGCVTVPRQCGDAHSCTDDICDENTNSCLHKPDDSKCPISHACDVMLGCQARAFAHDQTTLYDIRIPSGQVKVIGSTTVNLTDCALHPNNTLYGLAFNGLYTVDQMTGKATFFKSVNAGSLNGADVNPNGTMYVSGGPSLYTLNISTGVVTFVQSFPMGRTSSGDLAFIGNRLLGTANGMGGDDLVEFDLVNKTSKVLGPVGFTCVWGLAAYGMTLYGLTCQGSILSIDTTTGKGTQLNKVNTQFWGASAR